MKRGLLGWLSDTPRLIMLFVLMMLIGFGFYFVQKTAGGPLLDAISDGQSALVRLESMDEYQRRAHWYGTVFLDSLYPIAYGGFFIGLLARLAGRYRWLAIWPPALTVLIDYGENFVQAVALGGGASEILLAKDILTPLKFGGLLVTLALVVLLSLIALVRRFVLKKKDV